ncbi:unannotated protein [freshwater metagenome]|uniref:Unannotated protein n=1 Tax=freshwater metagenome TaxID=449393 RepID=A0A6J7GUZ7_9ZZZZ|nr:hypothetical protein [Actinomycetota bacterium]
MSTSTETAGTRTRWTIAIAAGVLGACAVGGVAAAVRDDAPDTVTFAVFAAMTLPFVAALVAIALDRTEHPEQAEDSIESQWATRASSGAFYDTLVAMGLATFATSVLDTASLPLWLFVLLGLADMATRLVLLQRREG